MKLPTKVLIGVGAVIGLAIMVKAGLATYHWYQARQWYKQTDAFMAALQEPFEEDTHGGKTPEETWALYVDAVKKRDIELASKYIDVDHQKKRLSLLEEQIQKNGLNIYIQQISSELKKDNEIEDFLKNNSKRAYYYYEFVDPILKKKMRVDVNFYLNPLTNVWKILY